MLREKFERRNDIAAVITEALLSNSGGLWPKNQYLEELYEVSRENDSLFILDEVVTGFRIGLQGAQGYFGLEPDIAVYGKAMSNGYPCAAMTGKKDVMEFISGEPDKGSFSGTFSGNPMAVSATKANLEILTELGTDGYEELHDQGQRLTNGLVEIGSDFGHDIFIPDFAGYFYIHFVGSGADSSNWTGWRDVARNSDFKKFGEFAREMIQEGIFIRPSFGRINMMHPHTDEHIDIALEAAKDVFDRLPVSER